MTEQQRRQQIMQARQQADQTRSAAPQMSDQEAERIASQGQGLTQEQIIAIAMMGKFVQNDITGVKKASMGDMKVSDVDMAKVMPSGIAKAMGVQQPQMHSPPQQVQPLPQMQPMPPAGAVNLPYIVPVHEQPVASVTNDTQTEFDFERKTRYEDIMEAIDKLENKIILLTDKINELSTVIDKKKLKKAQDNGTQAG
jgi:hypothetical protein